MRTLFSFPVFGGFFFLIASTFVGVPAMSLTSSALAAKVISGPSGGSFKKSGVKRRASSGIISSRPGARSQRNGPRIYKSRHGATRGIINRRIGGGEVNTQKRFYRQGPAIKRVGQAPRPSNVRKVGINGYRSSVVVYSRRRDEAGVSLRDEFENRTKDRFVKVDHGAIITAPENDDRLRHCGGSWNCGTRLYDDGTGPRIIVLGEPNDDDFPEVNVFKPN